jgi:hypothetical protein
VLGFVPQVARAGAHCVQSGARNKAGFVLSLFSLDGNPASQIDRRRDFISRTPAATFKEEIHRGQSPYCVKQASQAPSGKAPAGKQIPET